jgi:hypothetical protein
VIFSNSLSSVQIMLAGLGLVCCAAAQDDPKQTGPLTLVIQYKCLPGQRAEFRRRVVNAGLRNFEQWQTDGLLASYHLFFSRYVDTNGWDLLTLLTFHSYADVARWRRVEESLPAGIPADALSLTSSVETYPADLMRQGSSSEVPVKPVFFVIPYTVSVAAPTYLKYFDDYVKLQFEGWIREGVLSTYQAFTQRYTAGRPWDSLIVLAYKDEDSFGQREKVVAKVREQLQSNPAWKAASDNKQSLRVEKLAIVADELSVAR